MPHYWRIPEPDYNLDWAFKKITGKKKERKDSKKEMRNKKKKRKKKRYNPRKKKVRGARKKELARKEKKEFPYGRPMYSLEDNPHRQIIFTKDVQKVTGLSLRGARHRLAKIRKELGKQKGELVTLTEFCAAMKIERNEVIKHMD